MKEITRIVTLRITEIRKVEDENCIISKESCKEELTEHIREHFAVDDVIVENVRDFIRDI